jgi:pyrimidine operon attenuation protein/uracil phosphoribosyltransferase
MKFKANLMDGSAMQRALMRIAHEITEKNKGTEGLCLVGILRRGEPLAGIIRDDIKKIEGVEVPCGSVDIKFYRDDLTRMNESPVWRKPDLPFDVTNKHIILVDDVLFTGRTARAAMEAVISCGRPRTIQMAVLIDRGHRELPIRADFVGKSVPTSRSELIEVRIPPFDETTQVCLMELSES